MRDRLRRAEQDRDERNREDRAADAEEAREHAAERADHRREWPRRAPPRRSLADKCPDQRHGGDGERADGERVAESCAGEMGRDASADDGAGQCPEREGQAKPQIHRTALRVVPQPDGDVRHDHDQRRPLRVLLVEPEGEPEHRDRKEAAPDSQEPPERPEECTEHEEHGERSDVHVRHVTLTRRSAVAG